MTTTHKIVSNVFYYFLDFVTITLAGYIFWVLMGKLLLPQQYGVLTAILALFYILSSVASLGLVESLPKLVSELTKKGQPLAAGGMIKYSFKIAAAFGAVFSLTLYFASGWLSNVLYNNTVMVVPIQLLALLLLAANLGNVTKAALQGLQNFKSMFIADLIGNVVRLISSVGLVLIGWAAIGGAAAWALNFIFVAVVCAIFLMSLKLPSGTFDKAIFWRFSSMSMISLLGYYLILQGGILVLAALSGAEIVGYFGVAVLFGQILIFVPAVLTGVLLPNLSELWVEHKDAAKKLLSAALKLTIVTLLPFALLMILGSRMLVEFIYSKSYLPAASYFPFYIIGSLLYGVVVLLLIAMYSIGRPATRLAIITVGAIINIGLCFFFIPTIGATGAALAFLTSQVLMLITSLLLLNKTMPMYFSKKSLWLIPVVAIFSAIVWSHNLTNLLWLKIVVILAALAAYMILLFATKVIGRRELVLLDYFPDKFGFGVVKKLSKSMVDLFD